MEEFGTVEVLICTIATFGAAASGIYYAYKQDKERRNLQARTYVEINYGSIEKEIDNGFGISGSRISLEKMIKN